MGKKILKLFLDTMLRAAVIILAVAIVVMLVLLAKTIKKTEKDVTKKTTEATKIVTEETDPSDPTFGSGDEEKTSEDEEKTKEATQEQIEEKDAKLAKIAIINASGGDGVAGTWQTTLNADGYNNTDIGSYGAEALDKTTIYSVEGYKLDELSGLFGGAATKDMSALDSSLFDIDVSGADIVIVVGIDNMASN